MTDWLTAVNDTHRHIGSNISTEDGNQILQIGERSLVIPAEDFRWTLSPSQWFADRHRTGGVHEPRLVSWVFALADKFKDSQVRFYDVGALFGYFSLLAAGTFRQVNVTAVEGNPVSAGYIRVAAAANGFDQLAVTNTLLANQRSKAGFGIDGFFFKPLASGFERIVYLAKNHAKEALKRLLRVFDAKRFGAKRPMVSLVDTALLEDILSPPADQVVEIMKIDTEGFQAVYLPAATPELIRREMIVLLEFDDPAFMAKFGTSNGELVAPFLEAGYRLFWCDHREQSSDVVALDAVGDAHESNSLGVLIPARYSD